MFDLKNFIQQKKIVRLKLLFFLKTVSCVKLFRHK